MTEFLVWDKHQACFGKGCEDCLEGDSLRLLQDFQVPWKRLRDVYELDVLDFTLHHLSHLRDLRQDESLNGRSHWKKFQLMMRDLRVMDYGDLAEALGARTDFWLNGSVADGLEGESSGD